MKRSYFFALLCALFLGTSILWGMDGIIVTNISTITNGDKVYLATQGTSPIGVTGCNSNNKDATVSTESSQWVAYIVEIDKNVVTLKDESKNKYIASPGSSNVFKYGDTGGAVTITEKGVVMFEGRPLCKNGTFYRCYQSVENYIPFYIYKIGTKKPTLYLIPKFGKNKGLEQGTRKLNKYQQKSPSKVTCRFPTPFLSFAYSLRFLFSIVRLTFVKNSARLNATKEKHPITQVSSYHYFKVHHQRTAFPCTKILFPHSLPNGLNYIALSLWQHHTYFWYQIKGPLFDTLSARDYTQSTKTRARY